MKKILFILTLIIITVEAKPCMTDIYFGNGVWNTRTQGQEGTKELRDFMQINYNARLNRDEEGKTYNFKHAYNPSYGNGDKRDLIETFYQLKESGQVSNGYFQWMFTLLNDDETTEPYQKLQDIIRTYNSDAIYMFTLYQQSSFNQKHNVLLVAHSQGNLFGNKMYTLMNEAQKKKFRMVSVATPADHVIKPGQTSPYVTVHGDYAIQSLILAGAGSLNTNVDGVGHTFIGTYLGNSFEARTQIALYVKNAYDNLLQTNTCDTYQYYVWIGYMCPTRSDQELIVDIYGRPENAPYPYTKQLVVTDSRVRMPKDINGNCTVQGDDVWSWQDKYNKNDCFAYNIDDTGGNYHTLDYIANQTYDNGRLCTRYEMNTNVTEQLRAMKAN